MHLADITALRTVSGAGLLMALTRRCPLSCAHCSTDSAMDSEQYSSAPFLGLVDTFTAAAHPEVMVLSGGEALLRPGLVADLAESARLAGTRTCLMSGMYFARRALGARGSVSQATMIPAGLRRAIGAVDHFAASLDVHHEREVGRDDVFRAFRAVLDLVPAASFHVTGLGDDDPYIEDLVARIRREFDDQVPVLVSRVQPTGRARKGLSTSSQHRGTRYRSGGQHRPRQARRGTDSLLVRRVAARGLRRDRLRVQPPESRRSSAACASRPRRRRVGLVGGLARPDPRPALAPCHQDSGTGRGARPLRHEIGSGDHGRTTARRLRDLRDPGSGS